MISIFTLALAANESREVAISGEYFEIRDAPFPIALIELLDRSGGVINRLENPEQSDFVRSGSYETVRITNGPNAQIVRHFYGSGDAGSRRTSGLVQVIDGGKNRTISGKSFMGGWYAVAVPGALSSLQLWNPPGSGVRLVVNQIQMSVILDGAVAVSSHNAIAGTGVLVGPVPNKLIGAPGSVAGLYSGTAPAGIGQRVLYRHMAARKSDTVKFSDPMIVGPGFGVVILADPVNVEMAGVFEFFEEAA